jgi:hypothetical protein
MWPQTSRSVRRHNNQINTDRRGRLSPRNIGRKSTFGFAQVQRVRVPNN